jgi:copper chaperone CopZ
MSMKLKLIATLMIAGLGSTALAADQTPVTANATNRFAITGMHCDGCAGGLTAELKETRGVASAVVTFSNKLAVVAYDTNLVNSVQLAKAIKDAGFTAKPIQP